MTDPVAISVQNLSKKFRLFNSAKERLAEALHPFRKQLHREFYALTDVSFEVGRGEIVGVLGRNGSGKSTLLQIVCGVMQPTLGSVSVNGRISALLELGAGFNPEFTGRENVMLNGSIMGLPRNQMRDRLPAIEAFADIGDFFDQPVKTYSSGMFVRVAFAAAIHVDPEILIVDEALSVGDSKFQHRCFQKIREFVEQGKTILVVSHSTDTLLRICHRGIVLDGGRLVHIGPIAKAVNHYQDLLFGKPKTIRPTAECADSPAMSDVDVSSLRELNSLEILGTDTRDRLAEKHYYNAHETRLGTRAASIVDIDIVSEGKINPIEINSSQAIDLIVKIKFEEPLEGLSVGFAFVTVDGVYVFGTNMAMLGYPLLSGGAGSYRVLRFQCTSRLAGGEYFLNIGCNQIVDGNDTYVDVRRSVARIKFADTPSISGLVDLGVNLELAVATDPGASC